MSFEVHRPRLRVPKVCTSQPATQPLPEHSKKLPVPRPRPGFHKFHRAEAKVFKKGAKKPPFGLKMFKAWVKIKKMLNLKALTAKIAALKTSVVTAHRFSKGIVTKACQRITELHTFQKTPLYNRMAFPSSTSSSSVQAKTAVLGVTRLPNLQRFVYGDWIASWEWLQNPAKWSSHSKTAIGTKLNT